MSNTIKNNPTHHELQSSIHELRSEMRESVNRLENSIQDFVETIHGFANHIEITMATKDDLAAVEAKMATKTDLAELETKLEAKMATKSDLAALETRMVTKEYLDEKLYDLRGDLVQMTRKEDSKLTTLVDILKDRNVINGNDANRVLNMEPFARS